MATKKKAKQRPSAFTEINKQVNRERKIRKVIFINALAEYISGNDAANSIKLQLGDVNAQLWARVRNASGVFGYLTEQETEKHLTEFLK